MRITYKFESSEFMINSFLNTYKAHSMKKNAGDRQIALNIIIFFFIIMNLRERITKNKTLLTYKHVHQVYKTYAENE